MNYFDIFVLSVSLAMDCFAVSIAGSISYGKFDIVKILRIAVFFGLFQGIMPVLGFWISSIFSDFIFKYNHWFALAVLVYIGSKMIYESSRKGETDDNVGKTSPYGSLKVLLLLAVATSIDALATGVIFVNNDALIYYAALIIGLGSFIFSVAGCVIGLKIGQKLHFNFEMAGGIILILLGFKIFIEYYI